MTKDSKVSVSTIAIDKLYPDPEQPRTHFNEQSLQELADSIKAQELLYPILYREVVVDEEVKLVIVDGERRWRACKKLGMTEIPAIKFDGDHEAVALIGNIVREDLTAMEEALAVNKLKAKDKKITNEQLGSMLGKAESTISEILKLMKLPEQIQNEAKNNKEWSRNKLLRLAKKHKDSKPQRVLFERMKNEILQIKGKRTAKDKIDTVKNSIELIRQKLEKIETEKKWTAGDKKALKQHLEGLNDVITKILVKL